MTNEILNENEDNDNSENAAAKQAEQIIENGIVASTNAKHSIHCLTIIGQIVIIDNDNENKNRNINRNKRYQI